MKKYLLSGVAACFVCAWGTANALTLTFEEFQNGQVITSSMGVGITAERHRGGFNNPRPESGLATVFDTTNTSNSDKDLQEASGSAGSGGLGVSTPTFDFSNVLIVQNTDQDACDPTFCDTPNDNARGGTLSFDFTGLNAGGVTVSSLDLYEFQTRDRLDFFFADGETQTITGAALNGIGDDNSGTVDLAVFLSSIAPSNVVRLDLTVFNSGAIDNLQLTSVPVPASFLLLGTAITLLGFGRLKMTG